MALVVKNPPANAVGAEDKGRSPGGGHGNPLQQSYLENSMDRGAWQATVQGIAKSPTHLSTYTYKYADAYQTDLKIILKIVFFIYCGCAESLLLCRLSTSYCERGLLSRRCVCFSLQWLRLFWSRSLRPSGFSSCGMQLQKKPQLQLLDSRAQVQEL